MVATTAVHDGSHAKLSSSSLTMIKFLHLVNIILVICEDLCAYFWQFIFW